MKWIPKEQGIWYLGVLVGFKFPNVVNFVNFDRFSQTMKALLLGQSRCFLWQARFLSLIVYFWQPCGWQHVEVSLMARVLNSMV
jgi:hypothetical protein